MDASFLYVLPDRAYHDDPDGAAKRFGGRELMVTGEFLRIVPDGYGSTDLRLKTSNPDSPLGVDLADAAIADAKQLRPGQQVTVSCRAMAGISEIPWPSPTSSCTVSSWRCGSASPAESRDCGKS